MRQYDLAKSIFLQALDLPPEARAEFVREECAGDDGLRANVESLLRFHDEAMAGVAAGGEPMPTEVAGYAIERELGHGGMGIVYLARRPGEEPIALKVLRQGLLSPTLLARFRREAEVLARLDHPGIASLVATGVEDTPVGQRPWLAMEYVDGMDLRAWSRSERTPAERLELMARVCDAVEHAHRMGVVHRDLKPENVLVRADGTPVVLDFGVARLTDTDLRATTVMTSIGVLVGTIRYMSPEQAEGRADAIGPPSDVHALGVMTYELLTSRLPFEVPENSVHRALVAVLTAPPRPMSELPANLRAPLERVLRAALVKACDRRIASAAALGDDLRRVAAGRRPLARVPREGTPLSFTARAWLALASGAVLIGVVLSAWRMRPTPTDYARAIVRADDVFREAVSDVDSAAVRLHYTTRTLLREREAMQWARQGRELARTAGWWPWGRPLERLARFREGEAAYLIAERTDDQRMYVRAGDLWLASCDPDFPGRTFAIPDSSSPSAQELIAWPPGAPWMSASMAFADGARLAEGERLYPRALTQAREGRRMLQIARTRLLAATPFDAQTRAGRLQQLDALSASVEVRLGVALTGCALYSADHQLLSEARLHLRRAVELARDTDSPPILASHLHELGVCESRMAAILGDRAALDSALVHFERAYALRSTLEGYTSRLITRLELAQAHRLALRMRPASEAARHLASADSLLRIAPRDRADLGPIDRGLFESAAAGLAVDHCCVRRDTLLLPQAAALAAAALADLGPRRVPALLAEAHLESMRVEALRWAVTGDLRLRRRTIQAGDFANLLLRRAPSEARLVARRSALGPALVNRRPYALDWPIPEPY